MKFEIRTEDSWREALERYLAWMRAAAAPPSTMKLRSYHLRRFARDIGRPPFSLTLNDLIDYLGDKSDDANWSPNTARSMRTSLRHFYEWAGRYGYGENIAATMPKIKVPIGKPRPAPDDAVKRGERSHDHRVRLMVQLAAYAGMRSCEIAVGHTRDIAEDLVGWSLIVHGKGGKIRVVPLRDELAHLLRQLPEGYFFTGLIDGHLSAGYVSKLISRALPPNVTGHMLRHWFATKTYRASGKDLLAVQQLLGHASVATTQIYTAIEDDALRRAVNF